MFCDIGLQKTRGSSARSESNDVYGLSTFNKYLKKEEDLATLDLIDDFDEDSFQDKKTLPAAPYTDECYFELTTFRPTSRKQTPQQLFTSIENFLQRVRSVDTRLQKKSTWVLHYEFFCFERKNEFSISFFDDIDAEHTQSCLIEINMSSGNQAPFQKLVEVIRQQFQLSYAFDSVATSSEEPETFDEFDFPLSARGTLTPEFKHNNSGLALDIIFNHIKSRFADVQIQGWSTLCQVTGIKAVAKALLDRKIGGQNSLVEMQSYIDESHAPDDQQRLILKVIKNMKSVANMVGVGNAKAILVT